MNRLYQNGLEMKYVNEMEWKKNEFYVQSYEGNVKRILKKCRKRQENYELCTDEIFMWGLHGNVLSDNSKKWILNKSWTTHNNKTKVA